MVQDEHVQTLMRFGLTFLQAKSYLALAKLGKADAKTIAKASSVARQDIYRIMPTLQKLGLAEKLLGTPTMYRATPIREGYNLLLQNKMQEQTELQKKAMELIKSLRESNDETTPLEEEVQFIVISSRPLLFKRLVEMEKKAQTSIDSLNTWKNTRTVLFDRFQYWKRDLARGIKIRMVTERHEYDRSVQKILQTLATYSSFEIRTVSKPIAIIATMFDGREVLLDTAISVEEDVPALWSNNVQFMKALTACFEKFWNKAQDALETLPAKPQN
jgi:sugar-specific transcriptional regulator TrmB